MQAIFPEELKQPEDYEYLWRYIKPSRIDDFLKGEIFVPALSQFEDYYEGITPMHLFLLNFMRDAMLVDTNNLIEKKAFQLFPNRDMIAAYFSDRILLRQLRLLTDVREEVKIRRIINECIEKLNDIQVEHSRVQSETRCSCWFVGDEEESAAMWKAYSQEGGIAVRIRADRFRSKISNYVETANRFKSDIEIDTIHLGKVEYHHYQLSEKWIERVRSGVPLAFFKHKSFEHESEFRMIYEGKNGQAPYKISLFPLLHDFTIILHPATPIEEIKDASKKYTDKGAAVMPSSMWWPNKKE